MAFKFRQNPLLGGRWFTEMLFAPSVYFIPGPWRTPLGTIYLNLDTEMSTWPPLVGTTNFPIYIHLCCQSGPFTVI
jgi:hypothetical protein